MRMLAKITRRSSIGDSSNSASTKCFWASFYNDSQQGQTQEPHSGSSYEETDKTPKNEHEIVVSVTLHSLLIS
jgi:hypothetical protein